MIGIKEEVTGKIATEREDGTYRYVIDFKKLEEGSDLWLFSRTTDLKKHVDDLVVILSPEGRTDVWYELDTENYILEIYTEIPTNVSYRLTAPRFDSDEWENTRDQDDKDGFILQDYLDW